MEPTGLHTATTNPRDTVSSRSARANAPASAALVAYDGAQSHETVGEFVSESNLEALNATLSAELGTIVKERVDSGHCPSIFARVFQGERVLFEAGTGEYAPGAGLPGPDTAYRIASCSKSFTAATLLVLRERGQLNLDAPITDFVPEFTLSATGRNFPAPSVRMLMSMSGGLPTDDPWADRQESISNAELRAITANGVLLTTAPGTAFQYSNLGYALLGQVIEAVTGRAFRDVAREEILEPLGLADTGYEQTVVPARRLAIGHRKGPGGWIELPLTGPGAFSCIGGLFSSARDLSAWVRWLASAVSETPDASGPLSVAARREMQQVATPILEVAAMTTSPRHVERHFGYGFGLISEVDARLGQFVSHSGGYPGFSSHMRWHAPTSLGVVTFENATYSGAARTATDLIDRVLEDVGFALGSAEPWAMTRELAQEANALLYGWDDERAARIFEENVALDEPFAERQRLIEGLVDEVGGLRGSPSEPIVVQASDAPLFARWNVAGHRGGLVCEVRLSPKTPSLIQTFTIQTA